MKTRLSLLSSKTRKKGVTKDMKKFLEDNKIYFETIIAIILTLTSILVAISANQISNAQKEIEKKSVSPNIDIACEYNEGRVSKVSIINDEGHLDEINIEIYPFICARLLEGSIYDYNGSEMHEIIFPLIFDVGNRDLYQRYSPHTKNGILYEIYNSEYIDKISRIMESAPSRNDQTFYRFHSESTKKTNDPKKPSDFFYEIESFSLEYMLYIEYKTVFDAESTVEKYSVTTGDVQQFGIEYYADIGAKRIEPGSKKDLFLEKMRAERKTGDPLVKMYSFILDDPRYQDTAIYWMDYIIELYRNGDYVVY